MKGLYEFLDRFNVSEIKRIINNIDEALSFFGIKDNDIQPINFIIHNKLIDLDKKFKNCDLSILHSEGDQFNVSILGEMIRLYLYSQAGESLEKLNGICDVLDKAVNRNEAQIAAMQNVSSINKFFLKIRSFFIPVKPVEFSLQDEEKEEINNGINNYKNIYKKIDNYCIENDLVNTVIWHIKNFGYSEIRMGQVKSELEQLGLTSLYHEILSQINFRTNGDGPNKGKSFDSELMI